MENINNSGENSVVEAFDATPRAELVEKVKEMLTPEEVKVLTKSDLDLIFNVARKYLERQRSQTTEDALVLGTIARAEALQMLGGGTSMEVYVRNKQGEVVSRGSNEVTAMKQAQEMTRE